MNKHDRQGKKEPWTEINPEAAQQLGICDGIIAFFDILGFKNIVNSTDVVVTRMKYGLFLAVLNGIKEQVQSKTGRVPGLEWVWGSDSVFLYTRNNSPDDFEDLVWGCAFLISMSLATKRPVRGAIAFGEFVADRNLAIYLGKPIVEAIEEEKYQEWIGGVLVTDPPPPCASKLESLKTDRLLLQYPVPMKRRSPSVPRLMGHMCLQRLVPEQQVSDSLILETRSKLAIGWPMANAVSMAAFQPLAEEIGISAGKAKGRSLRKINNTIVFQNQFLGEPLKTFREIPKPLDRRVPPLAGKM